MDAESDLVEWERLRISQLRAIVEAFCTEAKQRIIIEEGSLPNIVCTKKIHHVLG